MSDGHYVFVDIETTELDPHAAKLVELACVIVRPSDLSFVTHPLHLVARTYPWDWRGGPAEEMHVASGLKQESLEKAHLSDHEVARKWWAYVKEHAPKGSKLAGNTIWFDRSWLVEFVDLRDHLHHRVIDVSSFRQTLYDLGLEGRVPKSDGRPRHRALGDVMWALQEYAVYRDYLRR